MSKVKQQQSFDISMVVAQELQDIGLVLHTRKLVLEFRPAHLAIVSKAIILL